MEYQANNEPITENGIDESGIQGAREILYKTTWRTEALQIPIESITDPQERQVIQKCINQETATDQEITILEKTLNRYRSAIQEQKPMETIENYEENVQYVEDEKAFLQILEDEEKDLDFTIYYPLNNGKEVRLDLIVKPITDAQAVLEVAENLNVFQDYTEEETRAFLDYQEGKAQTPEEMAIAKEIQFKLAKENSNKVKDAAIEFLAKQTSFKNTTSSYCSMKKMYSKMNVAILLLIFNKVKTLSHIDDLEVDRIFR
jgi:hypothetical protein